MSQTLKDIAQKLSTPEVTVKWVKAKGQKKKQAKIEVKDEKPIPKVQLIYAFNGSGKTRLSREFRKLVLAKGNDAVKEALSSRKKVIYYNAFTEDLFYWDNDLVANKAPKLRIQPNTYINWLIALLKELGQDSNIVKYFQRYANDKLTPYFSDDFTEVTFAIEGGDNQGLDTLKISKGEESNFIWSIFYTLLDQVINVLNNTDKETRETREFDQLEFVFIDDPVSSLDENHLIELAVDLAILIKSSTSDLKFVITTHSTLFYNVLYNELNSKTCYLLERFEDGTFLLTEKHGDSNKSFTYHLYLKQTIEKAIADQKVEKYHFTLLRNLYEKTASFLGYPKWSELLPDDKQLYLNRILNFTSHSTLAGATVSQPTPAEQAVVKLLLEHLKNNYGYWKQENQNG